MRRNLTRSSSTSGLQNLYGAIDDDEWVSQLLTPVTDWADNVPPYSSSSVAPNRIHSATGQAPYEPKQGYENRTEEINLAASIRRFLEEDFDQQAEAAQEREKEKEPEAKPTRTISKTHLGLRTKKSQPTKLNEPATVSPDPKAVPSRAEIALVERREAVVALLERFLEIEDEAESQQRDTPATPQMKTNIENLQQERLGADALADVDACFVRWLKKARLYRELNRKEMDRPLPALPSAEFPAPLPASSRAVKTSAYRPVLSSSVMKPLHESNVVQQENEILATPVLPYQPLPPIRIASEVNYSKLALSNYQR